LKKVLQTVFEKIIFFQKCKKHFSFVFKSIKFPCVKCNTSNCYLIQSRHFYSTRCIWLNVFRFVTNFNNFQTFMIITDLWYFRTNNWINVLSLSLMRPASHSEFETPGLGCPWRSEKLSTVPINTSFTGIKRSFSSTW